MAMTGINAKRGRYEWEEAEQKRAFTGYDAKKHPNNIEVIGIIVANHDNGEAAVLPNENPIEGGVVKADLWGDALHDCQRLYDGACNQAFRKDKS